MKIRIMTDGLFSRQDVTIFLKLTIPAFTREFVLSIRGLGLIYDGKKVQYSNALACAKRNFQ
jgi:hypothetical protein